MRITGLFIAFILLATPALNMAQAARKTKTKISRKRKTPVLPSFKPSLAAGYAALEKDDFRGAIAAWRPFFKSARGETATRALWPQFAQVCLENNRLDDLENAAQDADSREASPALRAAARLVLRRAAWQGKRVKEARNLEEKLNFIGDWQVCGPFENQAETGFEKTFAPEREDTTSKNFKGKKNRPLRWRPLPRAREGACFIGRFLGDNEPGVFYAATAINTEAPRTVQLRLNHSGAAKLWLNGKLIFSDAKPRTGQNIEPDAFVITQKLEVGWNSLLLKIADDASEETSFSLRMTGEKGADLPALPADSSRFQWQNLTGKIEPALPDLLKSFASPQSPEEFKLWSFAQQFLGELDDAAPLISALWPRQIEMSQKAARLAGEGKVKEAISSYREWLREEEFAPEALLNLARLQKQEKDFEGALLTWRKLRAFRPQDAEIAVEYAELLGERGDKKSAQTVYQQAITLDPSRTFWRERARLFADEKSLFDLVADTKIVANPTLKADAKTDAVLLLDEARQIVYEDRATLTRFHQIIQINSTLGARRYANFSPENPSPTAQLTFENAKVISGGKSSEILIDKQQNALKIPLLKAGDVLDITYRLEENQYGFLERQFWSQWFFNLGAMPVQTSRFVLITPPQVTFKFRSHGEVPPPQRSQIRSSNVLWDVREWRMDNLAPRPLEPLSPAPQDANLWIDISSVATWKPIAAWYEDFSAPRLLADNFVRAKALELTQNAHGEEDKLRALHTYVARVLREQKSENSLISPPQSGAKIMRAGYGKAPDKAMLLVALCNAVGIKARLALFNARHDGVTIFLPSLRFGRVMVVAQTQSGDVWLDACHAAFDNLPPENQGVPALLIEEGSAELITTPIAAPESNIAATKYGATLDEAGQLKAEVETSFSGAWGAVLRARWAALPENRRAEWVNGTARLWMPAVPAAKSTAHNFAKPDESLTMQFAFATANYAALEDGGTLNFQLPWQESANIDKAVLNSSEARTQEGETASLRGLTLDTLKLQLPPGFVPQGLPDEIKDTSAFGRYRFTYKIEGEAAAGVTLLVTREVLLSPLRVSREEMPSYTAFCQAIVAESARKIIVKK